MPDTRRAELGPGSDRALKSADVDPLGDDFEKAEQGFVDCPVLDANGGSLVVRKATVQVPRVEPEEAMKSQGYAYNRSDDELSAWGQSFTSRIGDGTGNPEEDYLSVLKLIANCKPNAKYLDIGCGVGRIIQIVQHSVGSLVGLEPELERFQACYKAHNDGDRIRIINSTSREYKDAHPEDRFDIIAVSMVLQHVPTGICDQILRDVREFLMPEGVAIIATTQQDVERFTFEFNPRPQTVEEFDRYAVDTANQQWGIPVRMFSKASFHQTIEQAGLHIIHWSQFSYFRPEKLAWWAARSGVPPEAIRHVAISQYAVVKRDRS